MREICSGLVLVGRQVTLLGVFGGVCVRPLERRELLRGRCGYDLIIPNDDKREEKKGGSEGFNLTYAIV